MLGRKVPRSITFPLTVGQRLTMARFLSCLMLVQSPTVPITNAKPLARNFSMVIVNYRQSSPAQQHKDDRTEVQRFAKISGLQSPASTRLDRLRAVRYILTRPLRRGRIMVLQRS